MDALPRIRAGRDSFSARYIVRSTALQTKNSLEERDRSKILASIFSRNPRISVP